MAINSREIKAILDEKNIEHLYHVNTVPTTLSYLRTGGLLSRGAVENLGLFQTPQTSDDKDKELGIWYDIFFDSVDIHERAKDINKYGPLTLVFNNEVLMLDNLEVKITKDNPVRWETSWTESQRYFEEKEDIEHEYKKGAFYQHLTICNMRYILPFTPFLERIIIDNPKTDDDKLFQKAFDAIQAILTEKYPMVVLVARECSDDCNCINRYKGYQPGAIWHKYRIDI